jgi:hypothetical protein
MIEPGLPCSRLYRIETIERKYNHEYCRHQAEAKSGKNGDTAHTWRWLLVPTINARHRHFSKAKAIHPHQGNQEPTQQQSDTKGNPDYHPDAWISDYGWFCI